MPPDAGDAQAGKALPDDATRVLQQFRIVFNAVKSHLQQVERKAGATGAQVWALHLIQQQPGLGVTELAQAMNVRQPTASILVKALVQQGLAEARREGPDRRALQLHTLPQGRALLRRVPGPRTGVLPEALAGMDAETLRGLRTHLAPLIQRLGADDSAATLPLSRL
jgi:DNA-binding MarR family transcriptional regulator